MVEQQMLQQESVQERMNNNSLLCSNNSEEENCYFRQLQWLIQPVKADHSCMLVGFLYLNLTRHQNLHLHLIQAYYSGHSLHWVMQYLTDMRWHIPHHHMDQSAESRIVVRQFQVASMVYKSLFVHLHNYALLRMQLQCQQVKTLPIRLPLHNHYHICMRLKNQLYYCRSMGIYT